MTPELDDIVAALFAANPTLLQLQYDPPHTIPADESHVVAWVSVQGDKHNEDDPSTWESMCFTVAGVDPALDMQPGDLRNDILALRERCDATPDVTPFVRHRNPNPEAVPEVAPTHDELKMRYASEAVRHQYMTADGAIKTLHIDPESRDATELRNIQAIIDKDAAMGRQS